jgi:DNA-binding MarR family transcriptional regulator
MRNKQAMEQARYIFTNGTILHDHIMNIHARELAAGGRDSGHGDMSAAQMQLIRMVRDRGDTTISELAERLEVSPPSASVMVDRLVEKGVLTREQSREDRRKVLVRISTEAVRTIEKIENAILQSFVDLVDKLGPVTAKKWCEVLERVQEVLDPEPAALRSGGRKKRGEEK